MAVVRKAQHGNTGVCAPPAKRTRPQQPRIWPQVTPLHRPLSYLHSHFCCIRGRRWAATERAACTICVEREFPSMSPLHDQQEGPVSDAWEGEGGGHIWSVWHRRAELSGVGLAHSHRGSERGADQMSWRNIINFWYMKNWDFSNLFIWDKRQFGVLFVVAGVYPLYWWANHTALCDSIQRCNFDKQSSFLSTRGSHTHVFQRGEKSFWESWICTEIECYYSGN